MSYNPKLHKKFKSETQATVSLDSLLGILSSAYGTQEIDSNVVFEENSVNWHNLSVETFKSAPKKLLKESNKVKTVKQNSCEKSNATTSTTSLKPNTTKGSEVDVTLVSIKSLDRLRELGSTSKEENRETDQTFKEELKTVAELETTSNNSEKETVQGELEKQKEMEADIENETNELEREDLVLRGFHVVDNNSKVVFDIKFIKKLEIIPTLELGESEISLIVTDIFKQTKTKVDVNKCQLVSKVQLFSNIDSEFGLQNVEVKIKCSVAVFHWIVQWVTADLSMCKPNLNTNNLKAVLLMAYHLKISGLIEECLDYLYKNCKTVLETDWEIEEVLDDHLFLQLVLQFSISEIEAINDYFNSFKERMYCSLIRLLVNPNPCSTVGHFSTLATIFQCSFCEKLFHYDIMSSVPCRNDCNRIDFKGVLVPGHECLPTWDLSKYVEVMYEELGSWKSVYWLLWGKCHFLKCLDCKMYFPLEQSGWCLHHPEGVEYFPLNTVGDFHPIGMHKCCGKVTFRFNTLKHHGGCKYKRHNPELNCDADTEMYKVFQTYKHFICCQPPENSTQKKFIKLERKLENEFLKSEINPEHFWWYGTRLAPSEKKDYSIISQAVLNRLRNRPENKIPEPKLKPLSFAPSVHMGVAPLPSSAIGEVKETNEPSASKEKKSKHTGAVKKVKSTNMSSRVRNKKKKLCFSYQPTEHVWAKSESNSDNQDNQRDFEEIAMRSLVKMLTPQDYSVSVSDPAAGSYIRLEADWWQENCGDSKTASSAKSSGTVVNRSFPLSWFRRLTI